MKVRSRVREFSRLQRDVSRIATVFALSDVFAPVTTLPRPIFLSALDLPDADRRRWSPARVTIAAAVPRSSAAVRARPVLSRRIPAGLMFSDPGSVIECARRRERRRVLIARGAGGSHARKRRGPWSGISC